MLAGLIMPSPASFRMGISTAAQPELNGPIQPTISSSWAAVWAFSAHLASSHCPAWAVASSSDSYSMVALPALPSALLDSHLYGVDHRGGLGPVRALKRQVADYLDRLASATAAAIAATAYRRLHRNR